MCFKNRRLRNFFTVFVVIFLTINYFAIYTNKFSDFVNVFNEVGEAEPREQKPLKMYIPSEEEFEEIEESCWYKKVKSLSGGEHSKLRRREKPRMIIQLTLCSLEIPMLKIRMKELWNYVESFIVVEADRSNSNMPKPLFINESIAELSEFSEKFIYIPITNYTVHTYEKGQWVYEDYYMNSLINKGLFHKFENKYISRKDAIKRIERRKKKIEEEKEKEWKKKKGESDRMWKERKQKREKAEKSERIPKGMVTNNPKGFFSLDEDDLVFLNHCDEIVHPGLIKVLKYYEGFNTHYIKTAFRWSLYNFAWLAGVTKRCAGTSVQNIHIGLHDEWKRKRPFHRIFDKCGKQMNKKVLLDFQPSNDCGYGWHCSWCFEVEKHPLKALYGTGAYIRDKYPDLLKDVNRMQTEFVDNGIFYGHAKNRPPSKKKDEKNVKKSTPDKKKHKNYRSPDEWGYFHAPFELMQNPEKYPYLFPNKFKKDNDDWMNEIIENTKDKEYVKLSFTGDDIRKRSRGGDSKKKGNKKKGDNDKVKEMQKMAARKMRGKLSKDKLR